MQRKPRISQQQRNYEAKLDAVRQAGRDFIAKIRHESDPSLNPLLADYRGPSQAALLIWPQRQVVADLFEGAMESVLRDQRLQPKRLGNAVAYPSNLGYHVYTSAQDYASIFGNMVPDTLHLDPRNPLTLDVQAVLTTLYRHSFDSFSKAQAKMGRGRG